MLRTALLVLAVLLIAPACAPAQEADRPAGSGEAEVPPEVARLFAGWRTDLTRRSIDLDELVSGGPPKDGIPSIDEPRFVTPAEAADWLAPQEPVVALAVDGEVRAYPLQILTWHEIVNDTVGGVPVAVTFCPLCYSAVAFDRRLGGPGGRTLTFGVSGLLRHSDLVMFDRETESLWQQITGEAIVGTLTGEGLRILPAQLVSFEQFREAHPEAPVLSRETGFARSYGRNPYAGYDDVDQHPFMFRGDVDGRLPPMEKVVAIEHDGAHKAYPHRLTRAERVVHDTVGDQPIVVFHTPGAVSALDAARIADSKAVGTVGVFDPQYDGRALRFEWRDGRIVDAATGSRWSVTGRAVEGPLAGAELAPIPHGSYFAFAWLAFRPETVVVTSAE